MTKTSSWEVETSWKKFQQSLQVSQKVHHSEVKFYPYNHDKVIFNFYAELTGIYSQLVFHEIHQFQTNM